MIQTSYFGNHRNFPSGKKIVSISAVTPDGVNVDSYALELAPRPQILKEYKEGIIDEAGYTKRYKDEVLSLLDPIEISKRYKDCIFLCYEKTGDFCHRHIVSEWLNDSGINIEEVVEHVCIAVVGSRGFSDYSYFEDVMNKLVSNYKSFSFSSGGAKEGADRFIEIYCEKNGYNIDIHLPDWDKHGKGAGFARNVILWNDAVIGIAFWDGSSKGTAHSFEIAEKQNKKLYVVEYLKKSVYIAGGRK